ncbi:hypothetical protein BDZ89DRAFT_1118801 [Hymenopellis radicata]|nr:hypothetical protein BDZ89DRAFT_1118801 [Hymenopellis radicata]
MSTTLPVDVALLGDSDDPHADDQVHHHELPPSYETVRPTVPLTYAFSRLSFNCMLLVPPPEAPDMRPLYHISVNMNIFNPHSYVTTICHGPSPEGEFVAEYELGITSKPATIYMRGQEAQFSQRLRAAGYASWPRTKWTWTGPRHRFAWNCYAVPNVCHNTTNPKEIYAVFNPASFRAQAQGPMPNTYSLEVMPNAQPMLDEILVSALLIEQQRLNPVDGDAKKLFNFRQNHLKIN